MYSLGCVLYYMSTSNTPSVTTKYAAVSSDYSEKLHLLTYQLLAKNPKSRPTIEQVIEYCKSEDTSKF